MNTGQCRPGNSWESPIPDCVGQPMAMYFGKLLMRKLLLQDLSLKEMSESGFDESVIKDEIISIMTDIGRCLASDIRIGFLDQ